MKEHATIAVARHDEETRLRALAATGLVEKGLRLLDELDAALGGANDG